MGHYLPIELFHWAGMPSDDVISVSDILSYNKNFIKTRNDYGDDVLTIAINSSNNKISLFIINSEYFIELPNLDNPIDSYIIPAFLRGNEDIVLALLNKHTEFRYIKSLDDSNLAHLAIRFKSIKLLDFILENNLIDLFLNDNSNNETPFLILLKESHIDFYFYALNEVLSYIHSHDFSNKEKFIKCIVEFCELNDQNRTYISTVALLDTFYEKK